MKLTLPDTSNIQKLLLCFGAEITNKTVKMPDLFDLMYSSDTCIIAPKLRKLRANHLNSDYPESSYKDGVLSVNTHAFGGYPELTKLQMKDSGPEKAPEVYKAECNLIKNMKSLKILMMRIQDSQIDFIPESVEDLFLTCEIPESESELKFDISHLKNLKILRVGTSSNISFKLPDSVWKVFIFSVNFYSDDTKTVNLQLSEKCHLEKLHVHGVRFHPDMKLPVTLNELNTSLDTCVLNPRIMKRANLKKLTFSTSARHSSYDEIIRFPKSVKECAISVVDCDDARLLDMKNSEINKLVVVQYDNIPYMGDAKIRKVELNSYATNWLLSQPTKILKFPPTVRKLTLTHVNDQLKPELLLPELRILKISTLSGVETLERRMLPKSLKTLYMVDQIHKIKPKKIPDLGPGIEVIILDPKS